MTSPVDICNIALGELGEDPDITAIDPPDGSANSYHCARLYPFARDQLLEMHAWTFASARKTNLAEVTSDRSAWEYAYELPNNVIKPRIALPEGYTDDDRDGLEFKEEGSRIYSHVPIHTLVVTERVTDANKFSPLFVSALSALLAFHLVGPVLRSNAGDRKKTMLDLFRLQLGIAAPANASRDNSTAKHNPGWIANR